MPGTVLVRDWLWGVCDLLNDTNPQFKRHPERTLIRWLNDAQMAVYKYLPLAAARIDSVRLQVGSLQSVETIAPADCKLFDGSSPVAAVKGMQFIRPWANMGDDGVTIGRAVRMVSRELLDAQDPLWQTRTGTVVKEIVYDPETPRHFHVNPPLASRKWLRFAYGAQPIAIPAGGAPGAEFYGIGGGSTVTISVDDEHTDVLMYYVMARSFMRNSQNAGDPAKVASFTGAWLQSMNTKIAAVTGNSPNLKKLPYAPDPVGQAS